MASGLLTFGRYFCCVFIVFVNIIAMVAAIAIMLCGILLLWGYQIISALYPCGMSQLDSLSKELGSSLDANIDIRGLLASASSLTVGAGAALLTVSVVVMVTACAGCWAACCNQRRLLIVYVVLVIAIFAVQNVVLLLWFTNGIVMKASLKTSMQTNLAAFTGVDSSNMQTLLQNLLQLFVGCCGVTNGTDFYTLSPNWKREYTMKTSSYNFTYNMTYPLTCCKFNMSTFKPLDVYCNYNNTNTETNWYQTGCYEKFIGMIEALMNLKAILIVIVSVLFIELILVLGSAIILTAQRATKMAKVAPS